MFDTPSLVHYAKCIPFVQRIINSSVNKRTGASPSSTLFADKLDLNRGILTPHLLPIVTTSNSTYINDLIDIQDQVLDAAILKLQKNDAKRKKSTRSVTVFPKESYVLVKQEHPPTRIHTKWKGPFRVVSFNESEHVLAKLITHKHNSIHVKNLKIFNYDPSMGLPADTARRDYMEYFVEKVLNHTGDTKKLTSMSFHVKWLNYENSNNAWEPWKNLRLCDALHVYLRNSNMSRFIPKNLKRSTNKV